MREESVHKFPVVKHKVTIQQLLKTQKKVVSSISFITLAVFNMALFLYK